MDISDKELRELVEQARETLGVFFKNEDAKLAKSSDLSDLGSVSSPSESGSDSSDSSSSSSSDSSSGSESKSGSSSDKSSRDLSLGSDSESSSDDGSHSDSSESGSDASALEEGSVSLGDLKDAYAQLSDEELKLHYLAAREVLHERMESSESSGSSSESSGSSLSGENSGSKSVESKDLQSLDDGSTMKNEDNMAKSEISKSESSMSKAESVSKAESAGDARGSGSISSEVSRARPAKEDVAKGEDRLDEMGKDSGPRSKDRMAAMEHARKNDDEVMKELESLRKHVDLQAQIIEKLAGPQRKAVTSIADLAKNEGEVDFTNLSREEVIKQLSVVARNPDLKKSERVKIDEFCVGKVKVTDPAILRLLKGE